jgi:Rrf2 family protein
MKLSTRTTYGLRALLALAQDYGQGSSQLREIAARQGLPANYLEQLMVPLRKAALVSATRGANGGYTLARAPREVRLDEVIEVLEGPLTLVEPNGGKGCCGPRERCALCELWAQASGALVRVFHDVTLEELLARQQAKKGAGVDMYSI